METNKFLRKKWLKTIIIITLFFKIKRFFNKERSVKTILITLILITWLYAWVFVYSVIYERDKIAIDNYNFKQLEIVKKVLNDEDKKSYEFDNIKEFNEKFNQNITPIKNCYFLSNNKYYFENNNWDWQYMFWFKLESLMYKILYFWQYYAYPKYNLVYYHFCDWTCHDWNKTYFRHKITNPCRD